VKHKLATTLLTVAALVVATLAGVTTTARPASARPGTGPGTSWPVVGYGYNEVTTEPYDNAILRWDERTLEAIRANPRFTGPTVAARALGIVHTATYDAWAAYDPDAVDTRQRLRADPNLRRPAAEGIGAAGEVNKSKAISFAAYTVLVDLFPYRKSNLDTYMNSLYPNFALDNTTPAVIGRGAGEAVRLFRHGDGSTQYPGDGSNQQPGTDWVGSAQVMKYPDTTGYTAVNKWNLVNDPSHWQPLCVLNANPSPAAPPCVAGSAVQIPATPQWKNVAPFGPLHPQTHYPLIQGNDYYTPPGPPSDSSDIDLALKDTSNLSETQKAKADYWADGPKSEFPPGHMAVFAQALSRMRKNTLDQDVKLFFMLGNAMLDSSISAWAAKYYYDTARPITAIRDRYEGKLVNSWLGPGKGYGSVLGENWLPYQEPTVVTPPFPEYVSGHSTFSAAGRTVLLQFYNNNDAFSAKVVIPRGKSKIEPDVAPSRDITITWKTLSDAADDAGWSRRWGGIHFYSGDQHGRGLGRLIGYNDWKKALTYFDGSATDQA
jgi:hypothetical protein